MRITGNAAVDRELLGRGGRRLTYTQRMLALFGASTIVGLWSQGEASGTVCRDVSGNNRNGTYTGVQLAQSGVDRFTSAKYDGLTSYANIKTVSLVSAFPSGAGTFGAFACVNAASTWSDSATRKICQFVSSTTLDRIAIYKSSTANTLRFQHIANSNQLYATTLLSTTSFFHLAMTWSQTELKAYINGVQIDTTKTITASWTAGLNDAFLGASATTPAEVWLGRLQYCMLLNRAATASEIAQMARAV